MRGKVLYQTKDMMFLKIHSSYRSVVALVDSELLGKRFEEGKRQVEIKEGFFKGEEVDREKALFVLASQLREDATFNIVGLEAIQCAIEVGVIDEDSVITIQGVPFALKLL
ncbi:DUF424 family protein [Candidatus Pacearchaeota archaeon]|nr:DUF424 family protein [Candidatus Pacearchaeota archaeon]